MDTPNNKLQDVAKEVEVILKKHNVGLATKLVYADSGIMAEPILIDLDKANQPAQPPPLVV